MVAAAGVPAAQADPDTVATLSGELTTATGTASLNCTSASSGSGSYDVAGTATGPYPGVVEEHATFMFEDGVINTFNATFSIVSGATTITGLINLQIITGSVACANVGGTEQIGPTVFLARYQATINAPTGTLSDRGIVGVVLSAEDLPAGGQATVLEEFRSDREFSKVLVNPVEHVNVVGATHTVTVTVLDDASQPLNSAHALITVTGANAETGQCTTGVDGTCQFTYVGQTEGVDTITACHDFDNDGELDPGEQCGEGTMVWFSDTSTPGSATGGGFITSAEGNRVAFSFGAEDNVEGPHGGCSVFDTTARIHVRCLGVSLLAITGTQALIQGEAIQEGVATNYTIHVEDFGNPGAVGDTFSITTDLGFSRSGVLEAGNIRVTPRL
jgi:hypothetical protein